MESYLQKYTDSLCAAIKARDPNTAFHSARVRALALEFGMYVGLSDSEHQLLPMAASLHDLGKLAIPDSILLNIGKLTVEEVEIMKSHATIGGCLISASRLKGTYAISQAVRHHHENHNGSGYPDGLKGSEIPKMAKLISLADNYDAMSEARPYRHPWQHSKIVEIMKSEGGKKHDPKLLKKFLAFIETSTNKVQ